MYRKKLSVPQRGGQTPSAAWPMVRTACGLAGQSPSEPAVWPLQRSTVSCPGWGLPAGQGCCVWDHEYQSLRAPKYLLLHLLPLLAPWTFGSTKWFYLGPCSPFKSIPQKISLHIFHLKSKISPVSLRLTERINPWMTLEVGKPEQQVGRSCKCNVLNTCTKRTSLCLLEFMVAFLTRISI